MRTAVYLLSLLVEGSTPRSFWRGAYLNGSDGSRQVTAVSVLGYGASGTQSGEDNMDRIDHALSIRINVSAILGDGRI